MLLACVNASKIDRLTRQLHCGMTVEQVRAIAVSLDIPTVHAMPRRSVLYGTHEIGTGRSRVWLEFEANQLKWYRRGTQAGWTGMRVGVKQAVCVPDTFASLVIHADQTWQYADVRLDGRTIGTLAPAGPIAFLEVDIPIGRHHLVVTKAGLLPFSHVFTTDQRGEGVIRIGIP
jgi:hypothetical protein